MSAFTDMDRDKVALYARAQAQALSAIFVLYQSIRDRSWHCALYPNYPEDGAINPSVRYVLPMGEITKLS